MSDDKLRQLLSVLPEDEALADGAARSRPLRSPLFLLLGLATLGLSDTSGFPAELLLHWTSTPGRA